MKINPLLAVFLFLVSILPVAYAAQPALPSAHQFQSQPYSTRENLEAQVLALTAENQHLQTTIQQLHISQKTAQLATLDVTTRALWAFLALIVLLGLGDCWLSKNQPIAVAPAEPKLLNDDEVEEYDYLNSDEALQAKLNMAHAYLEMRDESSARPLIEEVLEQGNEQQKLHAHALYARCGAEGTEPEDDLKPLHKA